MKICFAKQSGSDVFYELVNGETKVWLEAHDWMLDIPGPSDNVREFLKGCDGIITTWGSPCMDQAVLDANPDLKIIGHAAGSVADYIAPEVFAAGVKVTTANHLMAGAVADWCLTMTLIGLRRFLDYASFGGRTDLKWNMNGRAKSIQSATVGIWGFGTIASHYIELLKPLNPATILVNSNHLSEADAASLGMIKTQFNEIFAKSDVILLLSSLTPKTTGMVGQEQLALIKDDAVLINCGRGKLVDEAALYAELGKGRFTGILDVFHQEPLPETSPLLTMSNVILTPHNAGRPSRGCYVPFILDEFKRFFNGRPLEGEVSRERAGTMTSQK